MNIVTRFAPSPTGFLHIGGARTALYNYLFAKHNSGKFLLRIEDTDQERNNPEAVKAIIDSLKWLGLNWDDDVVYQHSRENRHKEIAHELVKRGKAYYCYLTSEELIKIREENKDQKPIRSKWRNSNEVPPHDKPVVRLRVPDEGSTVIDDQILGKVVTDNNIIDELVILRSDGTPTYMLAVVVDDHDMGVTHIIRGDDHLTNSNKQKLIYQAMGWDVPNFAHIPLIHGPDGAKLSKRHGALGVEAYKDMGYLPETMKNYLLRLGWSHGNDEIISEEQAIEWFNLNSINKSPSRLDFKKMENLNAHYIKNSDNERLINFIAEAKPVNQALRTQIMMLMDQLKIRSKTILELIDSCKFLIEPDMVISDEVKEILNSNQALLNNLIIHFEQIENFSKENTMNLAKKIAEENGLKLGDIGQLIRAALTKALVSISVFEIMPVLGKEETIRRLKLYA